jgi:cyanophycinase
LLILVGAQGNAPVACAQQSPQTSPRGSLVIVGGALREDRSDIWQEVIRRASVTGQRIAVIAAASRDPQSTGKQTVARLESHGASAFTVPLTARRSPGQPTDGGRLPGGTDAWGPDTAFHSDWVSQVRSAGGVFFTGGEQSLITATLLDAQGKPTPLLEAIWDVYLRGGVVAGTSAGAAIMSRVMFREPGSVASVLAHGARMGHEIDTGCGFLHPAWFVDQHFLVRGRLARMIVAMHAADVPYGIGIDENTALVVPSDDSAYVVGESGAVVVDLSDAKRDSNASSFHLRNARITYLEAGDSFNMETLEVRPAASKTLLGSNTHPTTTSYASIDAIGGTLGRLTASDVIPVSHTESDQEDDPAADPAASLAVSRRSRSWNFLFSDKSESQRQADEFQFRFYRQHDTVAWSDELRYTVANARLDITPRK